MTAKPPCRPVLSIGMCPEPDRPAPDPGVEEFVDSVTIGRPRHELYAFWRDFGNLPRFMEHVRKVSQVDSLSSIWTVDAGGEIRDWEFIITDDEPDRMIAWSASGNTPVGYAGRVEFKDTAGGTEVTAVLRYRAPSGLVESLVATLSGSGSPASDPPLQTRSDLIRFKNLMEGSADAAPAPEAH